MSFRLKSLTVEDFRSIRGRVTVSLDAPVVLIHGQNGSGKTSLLSAIELALTGSVPSLERLDPNYINYLPHKSAANAHGRVTIEVSGIQGNGHADLIVSSDMRKQTPLLSEDLARFFNERCYLAQSTLSRLLEIYQYQDAKRSDSPLTRFVKDLLGLDHLDALIDGLHTAGNVRRLRETVAAYWSARAEISALEHTLASLTDQTLILRSEEGVVEGRLRERLVEFGANISKALANPSAMGEELRQSSEDKELSALARVRRDLIAILGQWRTATATVTAANRVTIERQEATARAALGKWRAEEGASLDAALGELGLFFPNLSTLQDTGPQAARDAAILTLDRELRRLSGIFGGHETATQRIADLQESITQGKARTEVLDLQIEQNVPTNQSLAQGLSELVPYVQDDNCPVCSRDFGEVNSVPLKAYLSERISSLVESAGRLQALVNDKTATSAAVARAEREMGEATARQLSTDQFNELKIRRARLDELNARVVSLTSAADKGATLEREAALAARRLSELRSNDQIATSLRESVDQLATRFSQPILDTAESVDEGVERLRLYVEEREKGLVQREALRKAAVEDAAMLADRKGRSILLGQEIDVNKKRLQDLTTAKTEADRRIELAKDLIRETQQRRTEIVRRVFNDELNRLWRDLFVRLAPEEPFVPAFALPISTTAAVEAVLETQYRAGGKGGNPRAMLSAGNLNTAALTLFLALHLSVQPKLPCLLIDDPVQSMDEVHIAQFAALLRTLSKQKDRQMVIAVHEKPLFDYLTLELSPSYLDDRLITVELGKSIDGMTTAPWKIKTYEEDHAIAV
jgi:exonuclease SbcC